MEQVKLQSLDIRKNRNSFTKNRYKIGQVIKYQDDSRDAFYKIVEEYDKGTYMMYLAESVRFKGRKTCISDKDHFKILKGDA